MLSSPIQCSDPIHAQHLSVDVSFIAGSHTPSSSADSSLTPSPTTPTSGGDQTTPRSRDTILKSPTGILTSRSRTLSLPPSQRSSTSSVDIASPVESTTSLNVKFAPLPELAPRKRKSATPLGIAARGQMMRRRRELAGNPSGPSSGTPMWTNSEVESHQRRQRGESDPYSEGEDPLVTLGKMVKVAWRRMSQKDHPKDKEKDNKVTATDSTLNEKTGAESPTAAVAITEKRAALATIVPPNETVGSDGSEHEEGRDWGASVGDESHPREIGQTETIRDDDETTTTYPWEPSGSPRAL